MISATTNIAIGAGPYGTHVQTVRLTGPPNLEGLHFLCLTVTSGWFSLTLRIIERVLQLRYVGPNSCTLFLALCSTTLCSDLQRIGCMPQAALSTTIYLLLVQDWWYCYDTIYWLLVPDWWYCYYWCTPSVYSILGLVKVKVCKFG